MKAGAMTMEWKWSSSQVSGSIQHHYDPKKVLQVKFNVKIMLICFIEASRIVYKELSSLGQTVNQTFYLVVLRRLQDAVQRKYPVLWQNGEWWFHRNNAPAHTTLSVRVSHKQWHDPNYPLSLFIQSCSLWHFLFSQMKTVAKRKHLADMEEVKKKKDRSTEWHIFATVLEMLWTVENTSVLVHCFTWRLKVIKVKTSKYILIQLYDTILVTFEYPSHLSIFSPLLLYIYTWKIIIQAKVHAKHSGIRELV